MDIKKESEKRFKEIISESKKELEEKQVAQNVLEKLVRLQRAAGQPDTEGEIIARNAKTQLDKFDKLFKAEGV